MGNEVIIAFYVAVPIVILAAAFVYYLSRRREDIERAVRDTAAMSPDEEDAAVGGTPSQHQAR